MNALCLRMATKTTAPRTSISADPGTRDRLAALAKLIGQPVSEVLRTLSYADLGLVLQATARRGAHEGVDPAGGKGGGAS